MRSPYNKIRRSNTLLDWVQKFVKMFHNAQLVINIYCKDHKKNHILNHATLNNRIVGLFYIYHSQYQLHQKKLNLNYEELSENAFVSYIGLGIFVSPEVFNQYFINVFKRE